MDMDLIIAIFTIGALIYFTLEDWLTPKKPSNSVKSSAPPARVRLRSRRSYRSNDTNAGSRLQNAKNEAVNVPANVRSSGAESGPPASSSTAPELLTLTPAELSQLANAISARANGATIEQAILDGFGAKKGGGQRYQRAKALLDAAITPPSA